MSTTDTYDLAPIQVQERVVMGAVLLWLPHRKCMVKVDWCKYCVGHLNEIFLADQPVLQMCQISRSCEMSSMSYL